MATLLGLIVAAAFGSGDFLGGRASRSASTPLVLLIAQIVALVGAAVVAVAVTATVAVGDLGYGAVAGLFNAAALGLLYLGLATGRMGIVAPLTAVAASVVPITWGLAVGERPGVRVLVGVVAAVAAGALIASENRSDEVAPEATIAPADGEAKAMAGGASGAVLLSVLAGTCFGASFVLYAKTSPDSGLWPVLSARVTAVAAICVFVLVVSRRVRFVVPAGSTRWVAIAAGALDGVGSVLLLVAVRAGLAVAVAPVVALGPAFTVVWAWLVLGERISRHQVVGLIGALTGVALIASG